MDDKAAYQIPEFCNRYSVSRSTFYREIEAKRLSVFKVGTRTLIAKADAEAWFSALRSKPAKQPA